MIALLLNCPVHNLIVYQLPETVRGWFSISGLRPLRGQMTLHGGHLGPLETIDIYIIIYNGNKIIVMK